MLTCLFVFRDTNRLIFTFLSLLPCQVTDVVVCSRQSTGERRVRSGPSAHHARDTSACAPLLRCMRHLSLPALLCGILCPCPLRLPAPPSHSSLPAASLSLCIPLFPSLSLTLPPPFSFPLFLPLRPFVSRSFPPTPSLSLALPPAHSHTVAPPLAVDPFCTCRACVRCPCECVYAHAKGCRHMARCVGK